MHLLSLLLWTPLVGALLVMMLPSDRREVVRGVAIGHSVLALALAAATAWRYDPSVAGVQLAEHLPWVAPTQATIGVDGLSVAMIGLTTVLFTVALLGSGRIPHGVRAYHAWILSLEAATLGVFLARSWVFFYACWELTLVPLFFLINLWGGPERSRASLSFLLYTMAGSVFLLNGTLGLYLLLPSHSFSIDELALIAPTLPASVQIGLFAALALGFAVKVPMVPLHGWLPAAYGEAPTPVSLLLSGILAKMGAYGLLRAGMLLPLGLAAAAPVLFLLGLVGIGYGALLAWRQVDLKAMVAWSSVSHMGFVLVGIGTLSAVGIAGAVLQMVAHGLVIGLLFLLVGALQARAHTRELASFGGLMSVAPGAAVLLTLGLLSSMSMPGMAGFPAELQVLAGGYASYGLVVGVGAVGGLLWSATAVRALLGVVAGPVTTTTRQVTDLALDEWVAGVCLVALMILLGVAPGLVPGTDTPAALTAQHGPAHVEVALATP